MNSPLCPTEKKTGSVDSLGRQQQACWERKTPLCLEAQRSVLLRVSQLVYDFPACNALLETKGCPDRAVCGPEWLQ